MVWSYRLVSSGIEFLISCNQRCPVGLRIARLEGGRHSGALRPLSPARRSDKERERGRERKRVGQGKGIDKMDKKDRCHSLIERYATAASVHHWMTSCLIDSLNFVSTNISTSVTIICYTSRTSGRYFVYYSTQLGLLVTCLISVSYHSSHAHTRTAPHLDYTAARKIPLLTSLLTYSVSFFIRRRSWLESTIYFISIDQSCDGIYIAGHLIIVRRRCIYIYIYIYSILCVYVVLNCPTYQFLGQFINTVQYKTLTREESKMVLSQLNIRYNRVVIFTVHTYSTNYVDGNLRH